MPSGSATDGVSGQSMLASPLTALGPLSYTIISLLIPAINHLEAFAVRIYLLFALHLPILYASRAAAHSGTPAQQAAFVTSLVVEWKTFRAGAALHISVVLAVFQLPGAEHPAVLTAGFISLACSLVSFTLNSLLIVAFSTPRVGTAFGNRRAGADDNLETDLERQQVAAVDADGHGPGWPMVFEAGPLPNTWWNCHFLVALPAIWAAWSTISLIALLLLFLWPGYDGGPNLDPTVSQLVHVEKITVHPLENTHIPWLAVAVALAVGAIYFVLVVRTLLSRS